MAYPFERLAQLKAPLTPPAALRHIALSIGEPKHPPPAFLVQTLERSMGELGSYPATRGLEETRTAAARWLERRFGLPAAADMIEQQLRRGHAHFVVRNPDRRKRWGEHVGHRHVVVANQ